MSSKVFICYRRDDAAGSAGRVHDRLELEFGPDLLFMDVDSVPLGTNFVNVLREEVAKCDALLAIIGPGWLDARDENGNRRLENPHDFVRIEIGTALKRDIPVIPILLEGTRVPKADQLPDDLKELGLRQGLEVRHTSFASDMERLIRALKRAPSPQHPAEENARKAAEEAEARRKAEEERKRAAGRYRAEGRIKVDATIIHGAPDGWFLPGNGKVEWFQDYTGGPEMVVVPAGSFVMGSPESEPGRWNNESPQHPVTIAQPFAVGRHAVTSGQFGAFLSDTGYKQKGVGIVEFFSRGAQAHNHPVVFVSWEDARAFTAWLSSQSGRDYRLLTEAEWEYAARAGTTTPFWWGSNITSAQANYGLLRQFIVGVKAGFKATAGVGNPDGTVAVGSFAANPWGLYQVHGNVWEWCEDAWHENYDGGAPSDGLAWRQDGDSDRRVVRGGSWRDYPRKLRSAIRNGIAPDSRNNIIGFRLGRTLTH